MKLQITGILAVLAVILRILWTPLESWYIHADGAGVLTFSILCTVFFIFFKPIQSLALKKPLAIYFVLALYMIANGLVMGSADTFEKAGNWLIITHLLSPILSMLIIAVLAQINFTQTTKWLTAGLFIYCLLCLINCTYDENDRMNGEINANEIALVAAINFGLFLLLIVRNAISIKTYPLAAVPVLLIVTTGSRMGIAMIAIMFLSYLYTKLDFKKLRNIISFVIATVIVCFLIIYVKNSTVLGERLINTTEDHETLLLETGTILDYYGDRGLQYYTSWPLFLEHPVFGIGFHKWILYNPTGHVCHSEWMVQYVECGLIALILFVWFWVSLLKGLINVRKYCSDKEYSTFIILFGILVSIIYENTVLWSYNAICIFLIFALTFAFIQSRKHEKK